MKSVGYTQWGCLQVFGDHGITFHRFKKWLTPIDLVQPEMCRRTLKNSFTKLLNSFATKVLPAAAPEQEDFLTAGENHPSLFPRGPCSGENYWSVDIWVNSVELFSNLLTQFIRNCNVDQV